MESRRLPSRRNKRVDSAFSKESSPSRGRGGASANRNSSPTTRNEKKSPSRNDSKKRGRPKIAPAKNEEKDLKSSPKMGAGVPSMDDFKSVKDSSSSMHSVKTTTTTVRTVNLSSGAGAEADAEIARLTAIGQHILNRRSTSKATTPLHNLTPTPTTRQSRSVSQSVYDEDDDDYSRTEYSDNEVDDQFKSVRGPAQLTTGDYSGQKNIYTNSSVSSSSRQIPLPREFGGVIGVTLLLLIVPPISYYLQWCCTKSSQCEFKKINTIGWNLKYLEKVFDFHAIGAYLGFQLVIFLLSSFPLGRVVSIRNDRSTLKYYFNSLAVTVLTTIAFLVAEFYMKYPVADFIIRNYLRICLFSILNALIVSFWCYFMSRFRTNNSQSTELQNPYGKSGNILIDYGVGRDVNPKWCGLIDIKLSHYRISLITMVSLIIVLFLKNIQIPNLPTGEQKLVNYIDILQYIFNETRIIDKSALFCTILFDIYVMDIILFEHHLASSFELQQEGVGALLLVRYAVTPFFLASIPKYALEHKSLDLPIWAMSLIAILFIIGVLIKRSANGIKYQFRMNPNLSKFLYRDTVPTFQGRRILADHLWGQVRQPNYSGDILALIAFVIPMYWKFSWPPVVCITILIVFLIHRSVRVNARNFDRYSSAWTRYSTKVRHIILPKVF